MQKLGLPTAELTESMRQETRAMKAALHAGVPEQDIELVLARWIVYDMAGCRLPGCSSLADERRRAAVVALSIGNLDLAKEIISG